MLSDPWLNLETTQRRPINRFSELIDNSLDDTTISNAHETMDTDLLLKRTLRSNSIIKTNSEKKHKKSHNNGHPPSNVEPRTEGEDLFHAISRNDCSHL